MSKLDVNGETDAAHTVRNSLWFLGFRLTRTHTHTHCTRTDMALFRVDAKEKKINKL